MLYDGKIMPVVTALNNAASILVPFVLSIVVKILEK